MKRHPLLLPYLSLISLCFFWGTTYLAIRMALESFPPPLLVGTRFTISGSLLLAAAGMARVKIPARRDFLYAAGCGVLTLGVGNGCLTFAELWIPSSLAALLVTTSPFWMTGIEAAMPGGERLQAPVMTGMLIGLAGTALLLGPDAWRHGFSGDVVKGFLVLQLGCFCWSLGSIAQRRRLGQSNPVVIGAIQQLGAGLTFLLLAAVSPEHAVEWSARGVLAILYLVAFGSIVGYSSYVYALKTLPVAIVTIHTYVNPVVAAVLGWLFYREPFGARETAAMLTIFLGVAVVKRYGGRPAHGVLRTEITPSPVPLPPSHRPESEEA